MKGGGAFAASPLSRKYLFVLNVSLQCVPAGATNLAVLTSTADSRAGWRSTLHPIAKNPADSTPSTRGRHLVASQLQSFLARASENNRRILGCREERGRSADLCYTLFPAAVR